MHTRTPRAFALVVIVVVGVAAVTIATAIVFTAGGTKIVSTKAASHEHAYVIAEAGLERAAAYAKAVVRTERDFDRVLDPTFAIDCVAGTGTAQWGVPRYGPAGSNIVTFPAGSDRHFKMTPFNDGAYLTRFDDDGDDATFNFNLGPFTSNNEVNNCNEGPPVPGIPGSGFAPGDNPYRDRNRGVWATVIGIYPSTDPAQAKHMVTLRRYIGSNERVPAPIVAARDINVALPGQKLSFCSGFGDIALDRTAALVVYLGIKASGYLRSAGAITPSVPAAPVGCVSPPFGQAPFAGRTDTHYIGSRNNGAPISPPNPPPPPPRDMLNLNSKCTFRVDSSMPDVGLYFWDAGSTRGVAPAPVTSCSNAGFPSPAMPPAPSNDPTAPGSCWVPIAIGVDDTDGLGDPLGFTEVSGDSWHPDNDSVPSFGGGVVADPGGFPGHIWDGGSPSAWPAVTKPNWFAECDSADLTIDFTWATIRPGGAPDDVRCSGCTGANDAFFWGGDGAGLPAGGFTGASAEYRGNWHFHPTGAAVNYPAGTYLFDGQTFLFGPTSPIVTDDNTRANFPSTTLLFSNSVTLRRYGAGQGGAVGIGRPTGNFPSLVVFGNNDVLIEGDWSFAGGVYARNITVGSAAVATTARVFGLVRATGTLTVINLSELIVDYDSDLFTDPQETILATPTRTRTLP